jgi:hypothetical protein
MMETIFSSVSNTKKLDYLYSFMDEFGERVGGGGILCEDCLYSERG